MAPPTKKWIDKKSATTFQVRYRSQADPLIHDAEASDFVFKQVDAPNQKIKTTHQLEEELGVSPESIRDNEGEAAMYGVYYDDTEYDYMQHMRDMGSSTEAVFIDALQPKSKQKGKQKQSLEDALRELPEPALPQQPLLPTELLPSEIELKRTYQDQQNVPDALAGFQPDMDPRLREVLEALEDEAYVDDDDDIFEELAKGGETTELEFEEDDGWDSDATEKPTYSSNPEGSTAAAVTKAIGNQQGEEEGTGDWMQEFSKFKKAQKKVKKSDVDSSVADTMSFGGTMSIGSTMSVSKRRRRREKKGSMTASSGYSMTSSSLYRTEGLTLLDDRFDKIEEEYGQDSDDDEEAPDPTLPETRQDFNSIMDEFLEGYSVAGKGRVRRGKQQTGMDQLDEIRRDLGKARITSI